MKKLLLTAAMALAYIASSMAEVPLMQTTLADGEIIETRLTGNDSDLGSFFGMKKEADGTITRYMIVYSCLCFFDADLNLTTPPEGGEQGEILFKQPIKNISNIVFLNVDGVNAIQVQPAYTVSYENNVLQLRDVSQSLCVNIYNVEGQLTKQIDTASDIDIDMSRMQPGIYFANINKSGAKSGQSLKLYVK